MMKKLLCGASAATLAVLCFAAFAVAQDDAGTKTPSRVKALSSGSIRPFRSTETPADVAPNLYDKTSEEFNYFREDLGKQEISSKAKKRIADVQARNTYVDPMDKPAADGSKFINIFDENEVFADGKIFDDPEDPDVRYEHEENNVLAKFDEFCKNSASIIRFVFGGGDQNGRNGLGGDSMGMMDSGPDYEGHIMPDFQSAGSGLDPMESDPMMGGSGSMQKKAPAKVTPSAKDDSAMLFTEGAVENPFAAELAADPDNDFDLFKADLEFKPAPPKRATGAYGGNAMDGYSGSDPMMMGGSAGP